MLKEIQCDEFKSNDAIRPVIVFHSGLNAVVGNESGTNSVGKSTFLMILDFVFGGDDYIKKSKEVHRNLEPHFIKFKFEFAGVPYYFSRSTEDDGNVNICNEQYGIEETITIKKYCELLQEKYGLMEYGLTFRGAVSRFIRVDRRETMDEEKPFASAKRETDADAILGMLKLFGEYEEVAEHQKKSSEADDKEEAYKAAQKYEYIPNVRTKSDYKKNKERIIVLQAEADDLAKQSSQGLLDLDSMQAEQLRILKSKISSFKRQRTRLNAQLDSIEQSRIEGKKTFQNDYSELQHFFPELDISRLEQVEEFHRELTKILRKEIKESAKNIEAMVELATQEIEKLEAEQLRISRMPNVAKAILDKYAAVKKELQLLIDANEAYDKKNRLHDKTESEAKQLNNLIVERMARIELKLNTRMEDMNKTLYPDEMKAPLVHVESSSKYTFYTPDDGGTGMRYKGLVLFDLAVLRESKLPFIIHDSVLLLQIENEVLEKLLELYSAQKDKQVFISFDKVSTQKEQEILDKTKVLHLSRGGNELFGRSWNRRARAVEPAIEPDKGQTSENETADDSKMEDE